MDGPLSFTRVVYAQILHVSTPRKFITIPAFGEATYIFQNYISFGRDEYGRLLLLINFCGYFDILCFSGKMHNGF